MDTLLTEIMMFRELRESIQSEEDAAAAIRISRAREFKVKGLTRGYGGHSGKPQGDRHSAQTFAPQFVLAFSNSYSLKAERNERVSAFFSQSSGNCAASNVGARFRAGVSACDPATTGGHQRASAATGGFG